MITLQKVFVVDANEKPLLPTIPTRARILLKQGKAIVKQVVPFTIQLKKTVKNPIGSFSVGIDDGAKEVGIAIVDEGRKEVVFKGTIQLRQDVSIKMTKRCEYRKTRRSRKTRYRKPKPLKGTNKRFLAPTIRQKKDSILRVLDDIGSVVNISHCVVEQGQFDTTSMDRGYQLTGKAYQRSEYEGNNWRQKVLWRDQYTCQKCKKTHIPLQAHHIKPKSEGGTNAIKNGLTLCACCHDSLHKGQWELKNKKVRHYKYPAHAQLGKWYLFDKLKERFESVRICFGWMTAKNRGIADLEKAHFNDAIVMVCNNPEYITEKSYLIQPKRRKAWESNPTKTCIERHGFKHFDLVKASHRTKGVIIGTVRSLKEKSITLRTSFDNNFPVSYKKSKLLWRFNHITYI